MVTVACLIRVAYSIIYFSLGPTIEIQYFQGPNVTQLFARLTWGLFFPFVVCAEIIQLLIWIEVSMGVKSLRFGVRTWLPRLRWIFWIAVGLAFTGQVMTECLLTFGSNYEVILLVFRIALLCFFVFIAVVAAVFGTKLLRALHESGRPGLVEATNAQRVSRARRNLVRLVLGTLVLFFVAIILTSLYLAPGVRSRPGGYYTVSFFVLLDSVLLLFLLLIFFLLVFFLFSSHLNY